VLTNQFPVRPDNDGDLLQRTAAQILAIDSHAIIPHDMREARTLLAKLQDRGAPRESGANLRLTQIHDVYNALLRPLAHAKRIGVRSVDTKPPALPQGGDVSPDALRLMQEFSAALDIDVSEWERHTPDQRRIARLESRLALVIEHSNRLVTAILEYERRIARLEAIITTRPRAI
jgi:hypothetical protein